MSWLHYPFGGPLQAVATMCSFQRSGASLGVLCAGDAAVWSPSVNGGSTKNVLTFKFKSATNFRIHIVHYNVNVHY